MSASFPTKIFKPPFGENTYSYIHIPPRDDANPTIVFFHGFPSSSYDWRHQIAFFSAHGYGVVAPDLLGYGATSKPDSPSDYLSLSMVDEVLSILDHESLDKVHGVSHDFGSHLISRVYNVNPGRFLSLTFIAVPYTQPGQHFDLDVVNKMTKSFIGIEKFGYMQFLSQDISPEILDAHASPMSEVPEARS